MLRRELLASAVAAIGLSGTVAVKQEPVKGYMFDWTSKGGPSTDDPRWNQTVIGYERDMVTTGTITDADGRTWRVCEPGERRKRWDQIRDYRRPQCGVPAPCIIVTGSAGDCLTPCCQLSAYA